HARVGRSAWGGWSWLVTLWPGLDGRTGKARTTSKRDPQADPWSRAGRRSAVAAPKAPVLDGNGNKSKDLTLDEHVFGADVKAHLVHETGRAELSADRAGTRAVKSRGLVAGGRSKPWRQKGTGRARAGTTRA